MRNCWLRLRMRFDKGKKVSKNFGVKSVNLELVDRWHAHPLCIRYAFANPSQVAQLQESRSSAMSRLPRRLARPGALGEPPLSTKTRKKIGDGPVLSTREFGGGGPAMFTIPVPVIERNLFIHHGKRFRYQFWICLGKTGFPPRPSRVGRQRNTPTHFSTTNLCMNIYLAPAQGQDSAPG